MEPQSIIKFYIFFTRKREKSCGRIAKVLGSIVKLLAGKHGVWSFIQTPAIKERALIPWKFASRLFEGLMYITNNI